MAIKDQAEVLWGAWIGKLPGTIRERVGLLGGADAAARAAGVTPGTVRRWMREEDKAVPRTVDKAVQKMGGVEEAARTAGVKPRTIKEWMRRERRGQEPGKRQAAHIAKLTGAAQKKHIAEQRPHGNQQKLHRATLRSPVARKAAMSSRRASRMSTSGVHVSMSARVIIDTGRRKDERWREINCNFRGDVMAEPTRAFLSGNDDEAKDKLSEAFGTNYAPGTGWQFGEIRSMTLGEFNPGNGGVFPDSGE
ncbi:hypothetical protein [Streptomyces sp. NPDC056987]|uniref:hypothetical protein n=1 Tax=Streptomyces sp. NPDC056987 TaxID=3345988 RepID=UPI00362C2D2B